jgi:nucleoside-diphosphate-sugar epimerase
MKTILVTGANGFIGSHTLNYLSNQTGLRLIAACRDKDRLAESFKGEVRVGDLRDEAYIASLLDGVDVLVNAMAWTSLWGHKKQSDELFYQPTIQLMEQYLKSNASRYVNLSTTSAASPDQSKDALSEGIPRTYWPHLCNVIKIENYLREHSSKDKTMINMRLGLFAGEQYGLGLIPILLPRLKTHLVPWVAGGKTGMPIADGRDYGQAMGLAAMNETLNGYQSFNVVGKEIPTVREVIEFIHQEFGYPKPHFGVPFVGAFSFAWLMENIDPLVPWEPLIVRSIVHLLRETHANNKRATEMLGYQPKYDWREAIRLQVAEMAQRQSRPMRMAKTIT